MLRRNLRPTKSLLCLAWVLPVATIAFTQAAAIVAHETASSTNGHGGHSAHTQIEVPPGQPVPSVKLIVHPDTMKGWNLEIQTTNFAFAPERVNTKGLVSEGHAHLYVDGKKVTRLYGNWYYLDRLSPGEHTIRVTLNTNAHQDLMYNGKLIEATAVIQVKP